MKRIALIPRTEHGIEKFELAPRTGFLKPLFRSGTIKHILKPGTYENEEYRVIMPGLDQSTVNWAALRDPPANASPLERQLFELERARIKAELPTKHHYAVRAMQVIADVEQYDEVAIYVGSSGNDGSDMAAQGRDALKQLFGKTQIIAVTREQNTFLDVPVKDAFLYKRGKLENDAKAYLPRSKDGITVIRGREWGGNDVFISLVQQHQSKKTE